MVIKLEKRFGNLIMTRNAVITFFDSFAYSSGTNLVLDFEGIEFISRSAAHEYFKRKALSDVVIKEINLTHNVRAMFLLVSKQIKKAESVRI